MDRYIISVDGRDLGRYSGSYPTVVDEAEIREVGEETYRTIDLDSYDGDPVDLLERS